MTLLALAADETLLILKIVFLVLLYGFILLVVRSATKDIGGAPQESIILGAAEADALREQLGVRQARRACVVMRPRAPTGRTVDVAAATVIGREDNVGIRLDGDEFASGQHARLEPRTDGIWVEDLRSTNGTFVNGERVTAQRLQAGDVVRVGQTELELVS